MHPTNGAVGADHAVCLIVRLPFALLNKGCPNSFAIVGMNTLEPILRVLVKLGVRSSPDPLVGRADEEDLLIGHIGNPGHVFTCIRALVKQLLGLVSLADAVSKPPGQKKNSAEAQ